MAAVVEHDIAALQAADLHRLIARQSDLLLGRPGAITVPIPHDFQGHAAARLVAIVVPAEKSIGSASDEACRPARARFDHS